MNFWGKKGSFKTIFYKAFTPFWKTFLWLKQLFDGKLLIFRLRFYGNPTRVTRLNVVKLLLIHFECFHVLVTFCFFFFFFLYLLSDSIITDMIHRVTVTYSRHVTLKWTRYKQPLCGREFILFSYSCCVCFPLFFLYFSWKSTKSYGHAF